MWASRNEFTILEYQGKPESTMVFLLKHQEKPEWIVTRRDFNIFTQEPEAERRPYVSEVSARADYQILSRGKLPEEDWYSIENYYEKASQFIKQASRGEKSVPSMRLGFFFAVRELRENGFENFAGTKNISKVKRLRRGAQRRFVYELIGNRTVPNRMGYFRTEYQNWLEKLAKYSETESNLTKLASVLGDAMDTISIFPGHFGELSGVRDVMGDLYKMVRSKYLQSVLPLDISGEPNILAGLLLLISIKCLLLSFCHKACLIRLS